MAAVQNPSVVGAVRDGQALSSNSGYRNSKCDSFLADMDAISNCDFLKSAKSPPSACKWEELPWLKAKGYYSLAALVANKLELSLRLSWLHSHGKKRSFRMNSTANSHEVHKNGRDLAGFASNVFWRKKACVDWWSNVNETTRAEAFMLAVAKVAKFEEDAGHMFDKTPLRDFIPNRGLFSVSAQTECAGKVLRQPSKASFQIQIKTIAGKTLLQWVRATDLVQDLKQALEIKLGIPSAAYRLLHAGKQLEDLNPLSFYSIQRNSSMELILRLRGGAAGQSSSAKAFSYKDAVHAKTPKKTDPPAQAPKPFLVDKLKETPSIEIMHPSLDEQTQHFLDHGIICRFNGLWPRTADLYQWIHSEWTNNCKVLLCSKGFFIVVFDFETDYQKALTGGPWFWGAAGLFLTPWFPEFDPSTAVITKLPIWVRLPNLPANLWHFAVLQGIGNTLGSLLDTDVYRGEKGLYTYARICVEIDISKGLPDQINLKIGDFHWTQTLDYENTAFRCRYCHLTGHLQSSCPTMPAQKKKASTKQKSKSWKPHDPPPMDDFDFSSDEEEENKEGEAAASEPDPSLAGPTVASVTPASQKRNHDTSSSDSDKETSPSAHLSLQITPAQQNPPEWVKVGKKKGKKSRIVDSAHDG